MKLPYEFTLLSTIGLAIAIVLAAGCGASQDPDAGRANATHSAETGEDEREVLYWFDPMHPEQRFDRPGRSPFMDMDLVPRYADELEAGQVRLAPGVRQIINVRTVEVRRDRLWRRIDTVGKVGYDESRLHHIHTRVAGWIQEIDISAEGDPVAAGQRLFTLYSPELVNAQDEYLQALRRGEAGLIGSARDRIAALGVQPAFIQELERTRQSRVYVPWHAVRGGVVSRLGARHGMYVTPGSEIMEIADLSRVWVIAEVFDRHADWLAEGQAVAIRMSNMPGEKYEATVDYIYPELEHTTRTTRVRLVLDNPELRMRPGMWASVEIYAGPVDDQVVIPREALIRTGLSERVVLRIDDDHFEAREVTAGMESGDYVAIRTGLEPGEFVVTSGQFLIDSEARPRAGHARLETQDH